MRTPLHQINTQDEERLDEIRQIMREATPLSAPGLEGGVKSDRLLIEDEREFIHRFGFDWPHRHREALLQLKHEKDLTDREIRLLYLTGNLRRGPFGVQLSAYRWIGAWGWAQIGIVLALSAILLWAAWPITTLPLGNAARVAAMLAGLLGLAYALYLTLVRPWRIRKRTMT